MKLKRLAGIVLAATLVTTGLIVPNSTNIVQAAVATSIIPNTIRGMQSFDKNLLSLTGFASVDSNFKDYSSYINTSAYRTVSTGREFLQALKDAQSGSVKVIEITNDLDLGWNALGLTSTEARNYSVSKYGNPSNGFTHPEMEASGVSKLNISNVDGLTIFSQNGSTIKHAEIKLQNSTKNIAIRNLNFKGMWQWDDTGKHKEVGWTFIKVNGANHVWIDHCTFAHAADGMLDLENGSSGVTLSWCKFGVEANLNPDADSDIYKSISHMENKYQNGELDSDSRYYKLRKNGASKQEVMAYAAYHSKCHLVGSGDKDYKNYFYSNGTEVLDGNQRLQLSMAYCKYNNVGQRVPMIRQGVGHLYNCYIDDSTHMDLHKQEPFKSYGGYNLSRGQNARNGASIAADTCIYEGISSPLLGAECQGDDTGNMNEPWDKMFAAAYNHSLIVNSKVTNDDGTYVGSSWDNNGTNAFTKEFNWHDRSTIGKWSWQSSIDGVEDMDKSNPPSTPFTFSYDYNKVLPYTYQVMPLDEVASVVNEKAGAGVINLSASEWLQTSYAKSKEESTVKPGTNIAEGYYMIKNVGSGLYLDVAGGKAANGTNVQQWGASSSASYNTWKVVSVGDGYYEIYSCVGDGKYLLDISNNQGANGTNVQIWESTNCDAQRFKFYDTGNGKYGILTKTTNDASCLDVSNGSTSSGGNIQEWGYAGSNNQLWVLEKVNMTATPTPTVAPQATPTPTVTPNPEVTVEPTKTPVPSTQPSGDINVSINCGASTTTNALTPQMTLTCEEGTYDLAQLKVRYYWNADGNTNQNAWLDTAAIQYSRAPWYESLNGNTSITVNKCTSSEADSYVEITFTGDAQLDSTATLTLMTRIAKEDWSAYDQANDYSYNDANKIVVYYNNQIISGTEPK